MGFPLHWTKACNLLLLWLLLVVSEYVSWVGGPLLWSEQSDLKCILIMSWVCSHLCLELLSTCDRIIQDGWWYRVWSGLISPNDRLFTDFTNWSRLLALLQTFRTFVCLLHLFPLMVWSVLVAHTFTDTSAEELSTLCHFDIHLSYEDSNWRIHHWESVREAAG